MLGLEEQVYNQLTADEIRDYIYQLEKANEQSKECIKHLLKKIELLKEKIDVIERLNKESEISLLSEKDASFENAMAEEDLSELINKYYGQCSFEEDSEE